LEASAIIVVAIVVSVDKKLSSARARKASEVNLVIVDEINTRNHELKQLLINDGLCWLSRGSSLRCYCVLILSHQARHKLHSTLIIWLHVELGCCCELYAILQLQIFPILIFPWRLLNLNVPRAFQGVR